MAKSANSSNEEITKFSQCQNCKRYFEMEISLQDHFQNNEKCKQNHNREQQIIYIECPGPCTKKTYFKFGKSIEMHLKKSKCSKEVPSTFLPRLKKEFQEFKIERRKLSKHRYYLQTKSKRQKTTPPSPPLSEKGKKNEDSARDGESSDDDSSENGNATENSDTSDNETSGHENETEDETENSDVSDDQNSSKEICRGCSRVCKSPYPHPGPNSILGTIHRSINLKELVEKHITNTNNFMMIFICKILWLLLPNKCTCTVL